VSVSEGSQKDFSRRPEVGNFIFSLSKVRNQPFFAKNVIENVTFPTPGGAKTPRLSISV